MSTPALIGWPYSKPSPDEMRDARGRSRVARLATAAAIPWPIVANTRGRLAPVETPELRRAFATESDSSLAYWFGFTFAQIDALRIRMKLRRADGRRRRSRGIDGQVYRPSWSPDEDAILRKDGAVVASIRTGRSLTGCRLRLTRLRRAT